MFQKISGTCRVGQIRSVAFCDRDMWKCICLCAVIGLLSFGGYIYLDGGVFVLRDDFNSQQIPFSTALNGALKHWSGEWCWNVDLGTQLIGGYSFYNLGSPFFWISLLFHKNSFPYIVGILYILKYITAGSTSYLYSVVSETLKPVFISISQSPKPYFHLYFFVTFSLFLSNHKNF